MRVLILAYSFEPAQGGGPRWTTELAYGLAGRGHDVLVLTREFEGHRGLRAPKANLDIYYLATLRVRGSPIFTPRLLDGYVARFKPQVIQSSAPSLGDVLLPPPSRYRIPYVTLFHAQLGASVPAKVIQRLNVLRLRRGAWARVAVTSEYWQRWLLERGVRNEIIEVIPSTVARRFSDGPLEGAVRGKAHFLFVGGLDGVQSYKRFDLLLAACKMLAARTPSLPWRLTVVGDGNLKMHFEREAQAMGLGERVRFTGRADDMELHRLYSTACATILPSSDTREGWGLVLAEALCCGCPILLTDGIGGAGTFGAAPGAVVVPAGEPGGIADGLLSLLQRGPDNRDQERIKFGSRFHSDRVVAAYESMYAHAIESSTR